MAEADEAAGVVVAVVKADGVEEAVVAETVVTSGISKKLAFFLAFAFDL